MAGSFTITGYSGTEPAGQREFGPWTVSGKAIIGETLAVPLVMGDNTFTVPTEATACAIVPPENGSVILKVRTNLNSGDAGLSINPAFVPFVYSFPATAPTSLIIYASSAQPAPLTIAFI